MNSSFKEDYVFWHQGHLEVLAMLLETYGELDPRLSIEIAQLADELAKRLRQAYDLPQLV